MSSTFQALPGLPLPVAEVAQQLAHMWDGLAASGKPYADFRASQLNLILHLGLATTPDEGEALFHRALEFARRYPCRIVVLVPTEATEGGIFLKGKLFSQCYLGPRQRELCCCEALLLNYALDRAELLDDQVSLWLETDLPVYHWLHRVPADKLAKRHAAFLSRAQRILFDSAIDGADWPAKLDPQHTSVHDLAYARTLPLRQNLGQQLSSFQPARLAEGLQSVTLYAADDHRAEGQQLLAWTHARMEACARAAGRSGAIEAQLAALSERPDRAATQGLALHLDCGYAGQGHLRWSYRPDAAQAHLDLALGDTRLDQHTHLEPLPPEKVIAEALFF